MSNNKIKKRLSGSRKEPQDLLTPEDEQYKKRLIASVYETERGNRCANDLASQADGFSRTRNIPHMRGHFRSQGIQELKRFIYNPALAVPISPIHANANID